MLVSKKVNLREINELDTERIIKWRNNEKVRRNFFIQDKVTEEGHLWWLENKVKTGEVAQFIIIDNEDGIEVGSVFLRDIDNKNKKAEYGIFIGEDSARGKGIGTEAAKLICEYGFKELGLNRIFLRAFSHNIQAIASYTKAGFMLEGILKDDIYGDGKYYDIVIMAQLKK